MNRPRSSATIAMGKGLFVEPRKRLMDDVSLDWVSAVESLSIAPTASVRLTQDPSRRIILDQTKTYKIALRTVPRSGDRLNDVRQEWAILNLLRDVRGTPEDARVASTAIADALVMTRIDGEVWSSRPPALIADMRILTRLCVILWQCSKRGIAHNDIRAENVIVDANGECHLIDFDQATVCGRGRAILANFLGMPDRAGAMKVSLIKTAAKRLLPRWAQSVLSSASRRAERRKMRRQIELPEDASPELRALADAWELARKSDANSPGLGLAYYSFVRDGVEFPGERPWAERWRTLQGIVSYRGARVLELGCNMGLLSCHLLGEAGASAALGVDHDESILESASLTAKALHVSPTFQRVDFDKTAHWEITLREFRPSIVFALNVINWLDDKDRFLRFLSEWPVVIIEGHDSFAVETERMNRYSRFNCELVSISERGRPLMLCRRQ